MLCAGCKKKLDSEALKEIVVKEQLIDFTSQISIYKITGKTSKKVNYFPQRFYYPEDLKNFVLRTSFVSGNRLLFLEKNNPGITGILSGINFHDELDNTAWVDDLLLKLEEERIASEIANLESSSYYDEDLSNEQEAELIERVFSEEIHTSEILDSENELRFMEFDDEVFTAQKLDNGWRLIQAIKNRVIKTEYDNQFRIVVRENWNIPSVNDSKMISEEKYEYYGDSYKIQCKTTNSSDKETKIIYNELGQVSESIEGIYFNNKKYILNESKYSYDDQNRKLKDEKKEYEYSKDYKSVKYIFNRKYIYKYHESEEITPDFEYYENNILKMKNIYSDIKGNYTSQIFFEEGFSVKTYYESDVRIKDVYYQNNQITRTKEYE